MTRHVTHLDSGAAGEACGARSAAEASVVVLTLSAPVARAGLRALVDVAAVDAVTLVALGTGAAAVVGWVRQALTLHTCRQETGEGAPR